MSIEPCTFVYKTVGSCEIRADVYVPSRPPRIPRVLVYVHGGALIMGTRRQIPPGQLDRYLDAGLTVVSIDYRLAPETKLPEIIEDVRDAFAWVREKGASLYGANIDRICVAGCSAGGYLTLMTGFWVSPRPKALVSFYGYGDITGDWYARPDPFYCAQPAVQLGEALIAVGKTAISETAGDRDKFYLYCRQNGLWPREVAGFDPAGEPDKFKPYCPIENVSRDYPPTLLLHGDTDTDVPYEQSARMASALTRAGVDNELVTIEGGPHGFDFAEDQPQTKDALDRVISFLREHV